MFASRWRIGVAVAAAVVMLAGCDNDIHPGRAAVVNGVSITDDDVTHLVSALCANGRAGRVAKGETTPTTSMPEQRRNALQFLILFEAGSQYVADRDLTVSDNAASATSDLFPVAQGLDASDKEALDGLNADAKTFLAQLVVITANAQDPSVTTAPPGGVQSPQPGFEALQKWSNDQDISVNPEYGTLKDLQIAPTSGSLSLAQSAQAKELAKLGAASSGDPATDSDGTLPATQMCG